MACETINPRLATLLSSLDSCEPVEIIRAIKSEASTVRLAIMELERTRADYLRSQASTCAPPELSGRILAAFWSMHQNNPNGLASRKARRVFCRQMAMIVGVGSLTFQQVSTLCDKAQEEVLRFEEYRCRTQVIRAEAEALIAQERSYLDACSDLLDQLQEDERAS